MRLIRLLPRNVAVFLLCALFASTGDAASITAYVNKQFEYLNPGMPASLELGQDVNHTFVINQNTTGSPISSGIFYENAITDFEFALPAVGFHFSGGHGDITHRNDGSLLLTGFAPTIVNLDGQNFVRSQVSLIPRHGAPAPTGSAIQSLRSFEFDSFELTFYNPTLGGYSLGDLWDLLDINTPSITGSTAGLLATLNSNFSLSSGLLWDVSNFSTDGTITIAIPEQSTALLLLPSAFPFVFRRRRSTFN
ncbi:MAG: hypothetical protein AAF591_04320 [Verrucomicrobiota bacterium]